MMTKEMFEILESVLKETVKEDEVVKILDKGTEHDFPCNCIYDTNSRNTFAFGISDNTKCDISNQSQASYLCSSKNMYEYSDEQVRVKAKFTGTIKSVYVYKGKTSFSIAPSEILVRMDVECKGSKLYHYSYQEFEQYLAKR